MKIQLFRNLKGLIYGSDPKRILCDKDGTLKIGTTEIGILAGNETILPLLFGGCTGQYNASFEDKLGNIYELDKVTVRGGRVDPPPKTALELMELHIKVDELEARCEKLEEKTRELENIFDTNSLNFLIN